MIRALLSVAAFLTFLKLAMAQGQASADPRYLAPKHYDGYFPWTPPQTKEAWGARRVKVREQVLVANGLWPMPDKIPLKPIIHGKIERDGYTIEKVFFASLPGHYVCGNLYRPTGKTGKLPAVLCPHGHWENGRLYEANDTEIASQMKQGAEKTREGAKYPLQARCAQLARMGCVVFFYDMVGYADSMTIPHRRGFRDPEAELQLQSFMGLQTFNCIRALDFLLSLPEVDPARVGVTGASGGGTQTFVLCAIDDRSAAAFPAVMVSTSMQGGCICENCSYLRVGTGNIELAALIAPRPLGMSGADDWTREIETKGLPELKQIYKLYGADDKVMAKAYRQFGHNYNQVSRELMYNFFNKHLKLDQKEPVKEQPFVPAAPKELRVFDDGHPLPEDAVGADGMRRWWREQAEGQLRALLPKDKKSLQEFRDTIGPALRVMIGAERESAGDLDVTTARENGYTQGHLTRKNSGEKIPVRLIQPADGKSKGEVAVFVHPEGLDALSDGKAWIAPVQRLLDGGVAVLGIEPYRTGSTVHEHRYLVNKDFAGYTFGYNRPLLAERVRDILTAINHAKGNSDNKSVHLIGIGEAGPWAVLARALAGDAVKRTAADLNGFRFNQVLGMDDDMMLPGALRYGGLLTLAGLCAPGELYLHNGRGSGSQRFIEAAYDAGGHGGKLRFFERKSEPADVVDWLLR